MLQSLSTGWSLNAQWGVTVFRRPLWLNMLLALALKERALVKMLLDRWTVTISLQLKFSSFGR